MSYAKVSLNTKALKWLRINNRVKGFLSVCTWCFGLVFLKSFILALKNSIELVC
ncbi:hypothetical protein BPUTSESOX_2098 [uncultured Gammaproteobacteria bacterium]|nr:hypothetical protein [uncultured Gammaproteobacteria bacterium]CAC9651308.1 hypothetical protein [uncultured Gammaproteobacteria bacterium]SSC10446.1 hypothetical protein BPUTEOSOX_1913 [thiotrophic endosymbiont of Bathymodiolus puteoserpentis (Logatchev)]VVH50645.1 hypothetical protein BPUTSESOX_2098 [uncultured Gammaproteobacteria bacterium]